MDPTIKLSFSGSNLEAKLKILKKVLPVAQKVVTIAGIIVS
jgi:hypothetical protein